MPGDEHIAVGDHLFRASAPECYGSGGVPIHLVLGSGKVFVGVEFEDHRTSVGDSASLYDEGLPILAAVNFPQWRRAHEHIVSVGKSVIAVVLAVVEVRDAGYDDLFQLRALADE